MPGTRHSLLRDISDFCTSTDPRDVREYYDDKGVPYDLKIHSGSY